MIENEIRVRLRGPILGLLVLFFAASTAFGQEDQEFQYLFAGMSQERAKLKSWSCTVNGADGLNGRFDMKFLSDGENVRFTRTSTGHPKEIEHVAANKDTIVVWDVALAACVISKSTPEGWQTLKLFDPRVAGLKLDPNEVGYEKVIANRREWWSKSFTIHRDGALRTVVFTKSTEWQDMWLSLTIDTERGFIYSGRLNLSQLPRPA